MSVAPGPNCASTAQTAAMAQLFGLCPLVWTFSIQSFPTCRTNCRTRSTPPEILMYRSLSGALGSTLSTLDCCPIRFMRMCALHTCTEIPPCGGGYGPTKSTFINESPAPQLERYQRPELQIQWSASIVHFDQPLDV